MPTGDRMCPDCEMLLPCKCSYTRPHTRVNYADVDLRHVPCHASEQTFTPIDPEHYKRLTPEPWDVIDGWNLGYYEGQVVKYLARAGRKGGEGKRLEDLKKAATYLRRRIELLEKSS